MVETTAPAWSRRRFKPVGVCVTRLGRSGLSRLNVAHDLVSRKYVVVVSLQYIVLGMTKGETINTHTHENQKGSFETIYYHIILRRIV